MNLLSRFALSPSDVLWRLHEIGRGADRGIRSRVWKHLKRREWFRERCIDDRIIFKWTLRKQDKNCTELAQESPMPDLCGDDSEILACTTSVLNK